MSSKKEKMGVCINILYQISILKIAIVDNNFSDFFIIFNKLEDLCYEFDKFVMTPDDLNSLRMLDCLSSIEDAVFSNDLFGVINYILKLKSMVNSVINSVDGGEL